MKTIVIAGADSNVGNATPAHQIEKTLPGAVLVKIGQEVTDDAGAHGLHFPMGTSLATLADRYASASFLIVETNAVLNEDRPDLLIYLGERSPSEPWARRACSQADICRGTLVGGAMIERLAARLNVDRAAVRKLVWLAGARPEPATAIILAGGRSRRMGQDKARLALRGTTLLDSLCAQLVPFFDEILLSVAAQPVEPSPKHIRIAVDRAPDRGPLGGIASALHVASSRVCFVVACDIPCVNQSLLFHLLASSEDAAIVVPSFRPDYYEPLFAVYHKTVAEEAEQALEAGERRVIALFDRTRTTIVAVEDDSWYANLNTPADYAAYRGREGRAGETKGDGLNFLT